MIVDLFLERDEKAIHNSREKYGKRLNLLSSRIVKDKQAAEECENDTYMKAWNSIPPNEPREYLYPFLAQITRRLSLNYCRDKQRLKRNAHICELSMEMEACIPDPNDGECKVRDIELKQTINGFLATLSEEKRNIFLRRYWYCDSITEIAEIFEISESKAKTTLFRIRNLFRTYLKKEGYTI